jgi:hypothetical protein
MLLAFIWKIHRCGIWRVIADDPQLLQRVRRAWKPTKRTMIFHLALADYHAGILKRPHAARCAARHGVRSHPVPVALVGECSIPVV